MDSHAGGQPETGVFGIRAQPERKVPRALFTLIRPGLEQLLGLSRLNDMYAVAMDRHDPRPFSDIAIESLQITPIARPEPHACVPSSGPLIVIANHPFGGIDGLVLYSLLTRVRPDVKVLGNFLLAQIPDLRDTIICVDPFDKSGRAKGNASGLRQAIRWVKGGGVLIVFPAGEVSPVRCTDRLAEDSAWNDSMTRLIQACEAPVLPAFFEGTNSPLFYGLGLLHPSLRTAMLPRELLRRRRSEVTIHFGRPLAPKNVRRLEVGEATAYFRLHTYALSARTSGAQKVTPDSDSASVSASASAPAVRAASRRAGPAAEIAPLIARADLVQHERFSVVLTTRRESPTLLDEICRARALVFHGAHASAHGQGHDAAAEAEPADIDRDRFDDYYQQLVLWDRKREVVAGGYRIGKTDEILPRRGVRGLYTSTLFRFDRRFFDSLGPALELGRSFVLQDYQKDFAPLMLLWKGLGRVIAGEGRYLHLFGAVSISRQYSEMTRAMVSGYLRASREIPGARSVAVPRNPPRFAKATTRLMVRGLERLSVADFDELIREIENGERGLPVLLRHYLSLNAQVLGMNVDRAFGDVLDALMLLDLRDVPAAMLARFVGAQAAALIGRAAVERRTA